MSAFSKLWDNEVKALANACVTEPKLVELVMKGGTYEPTKEEKAYWEEVGEKYLDPCGMYYISDLIWRVEHALADDREWQAKIALLMSIPLYLQTVIFKMSLMAMKQMKNGKQEQHCVKV